MDDSRGPAIVIQGSVIQGFKFHGPFETIAEAVKWWQSTPLGKLEQMPVTVALLEQP